MTPSNKTPLFRLQNAYYKARFVVMASIVMLVNAIKNPGSIQPGAWVAIIAFVFVVIVTLAN